MRESGVHVEHEKDRQTHGRARDRAPDNARRVEEGDDQHGAEVVDDRQRGRKTLRPMGTRGPSRASNPEGERDVGRHRNPPAVDAGGATGDEEEEQRRHDHAADRRRDRERSLSRRRQLADQDLALDLEADQQEEESPSGRR